MRSDSFRILPGVSLLDVSALNVLTSRASRFRASISIFVASIFCFGLSAQAQAPIPAPPQLPQARGAAGATTGVGATLIEPKSTGAPSAPPAGLPAISGAPSAGANNLPVARPPNANGAPVAEGKSGTEFQTDSVSESLFAGLMDPFEYDPRGRKDPFVQPIPEKALTPGSLHGPILPLQAFNLDQLRLVGIIWDVRHPKAMIKDPEGKTHIVGPNTKLGPKNGYIAVIREGEMVVVETTEQMGKLSSTAQVVKIAK